MYRRVLTINQDQWIGESGAWSGNKTFSLPSSVRNYNTVWTLIKTTKPVVNLIYVKDEDDNEYFRDKGDTHIIPTIELTLVTVSLAASLITLSMTSTIDLNKIVQIKVEFMFDFMTNNDPQYYNKLKLPYIYPDTNSDVLPNFFGDFHSTATHKMDGIKAPRFEWTQPETPPISTIYELTKYVDFPKSEITDIDKSTIICMPETIKLTGNGIFFLLRGASVSYLPSQDPSISDQFLITASIRVTRAFPASASIDIEFSFKYQKASVDHIAVLEYTPRPSEPDNWTYGTNYNSTKLNYGYGARHVGDHAISIWDRGIPEIYTPGWKPSFSNRILTLLPNLEEDINYYIKIETNAIKIYRFPAGSAPIFSTTPWETLTAENFKDNALPKRIIAFIQGCGGDGAGAWGGGGSGGTCIAVLNTERSPDDPYYQNGKVLVWKIHVGFSGNKATSIEPYVFWPKTNTLSKLKAEGIWVSSGKNGSSNDGGKGGSVTTVNTRALFAVLLAANGADGGFGNHSGDSQECLCYSTNIENDRYGTNKFYSYHTGGQPSGTSVFNISGGGGASALHDGGDGGSDAEHKNGVYGSGGGAGDGTGGDGVVYLYY